MASVLKVDKLDPQSGTALEIGTSGDTISVPSGATLDISSATLTPPATLPASSGVNLTALNATNLGSGTVPTARLGTGTASSSTVLYGDQTYKAEPGGAWVKIASGASSSAANHDFTSVFDSTYYVYRLFMHDITQASAGTDYANLHWHWIVGGTVQTATSMVWAWQSVTSGDNTATTAIDGDEFNQAYGVMGEAYRFDPDDIMALECTVFMDPLGAYAGDMVLGATMGGTTGSHFTRSDFHHWYNSASTKTGMRINASDGDSFEFNYEWYGLVK